jgi:kynureninase
MESPTRPPAGRVKFFFFCDYNSSMASLKKYFLLDPQVVFLNHGSFGATPRPVFRAYQRWQREL